VDEGGTVTVYQRGQNISFVPAIPLLPTPSPCVSIREYGMNIRRHQAMGCDMVVAIPAATGNGQTLFAANSHRPVSEGQTLRLVRGRTYAPDEALQTRFVRLPQVRQTYTFLAAQPSGSWGALQGINEHRVALACSDWQSRLWREQPAGPGTLAQRPAGSRSGDRSH
jgi:hypothetical protein